MEDHLLKMMKVYGHTKWTNETEKSDLVKQAKVECNHVDRWYIQ